MSERYLITGIAGFIGGHLAERLLREGVEVVGVDNFSTGRRENVEPILDRIRFIEGDLCDPEVSRRACDGVKVILHQASVPSVPRSLADPLTSLHSSVTATVTLLEAARKAGVWRLVQAASSSAYGNTEVLPKHEGMLPSPLSPYAVAKLSQEYYARAYCHCFGIDTASLRYFNVFGPRQDPSSHYAAVIPRFITRMLRGESPVIFGDGNQSRDFTFVANVVEGNWLAATRPEPLNGAMMNLACGDRISLLDLVQRLNRILGTSIEAIHEPSRPGDVTHSQASIDRAAELLGFRTVCDFDEGLAQTAAFYRDRNPDRA